MIVAHHLIWTGYGWWLPNDPRGSMSCVVRNDVIADLGALHHGRKSVQPASREIRRFYEEAQSRLQHDLRAFSDRDILSVGESFADAVARYRYTCYACAILPDHVHILIRRHRDEAAVMIRLIQDHSRLRFRDAGLAPPDHPVWGGPGWVVYLDHPDEVRRTIRYINDNPKKLHIPEQKWSFVKEYDGWPLHPGHSPNSPYARTRHGERYRR